MTDGFAHHFNLGESTFSFIGIRDNFKIYFHFFMKVNKANRIWLPDDWSRLLHRFTVININDTPVPIGQIHSFHSYV